MNATGTKSTTTEKLTELVRDAIYETQLDERLHETRHFQSDGILTSNEGFTIRLLDGSEFQVTIVRSK